MRHFVLLLVLVGCQSGTESGPGVSVAYKKDVERICDVEKLSGVADHPGENAQVLTAMWLGDNLETDQARDFLATLSPMPPVEKANALRNEAKRAGLAGCALASTWK